MAARGTGYRTRLTGTNRDISTGAAEHREWPPDDDAERGIRGSCCLNVGTFPDTIGSAFPSSLKGVHLSSPPKCTSKAVTTSEVWPRDFWHIVVLTLRLSSSLSLAEPVSLSAC